MRLAFGLVIASCVLGGCGPAAAPQGYRPADDDCAPLVGHWSVHHADLPRIAPHLELPPDVTFPFLSLEQGVGGGVHLVFRRHRADVLAEAGTLRSKNADDYRHWRSRALGEELDSELHAYTPTQPGPPVRRDWRLSLGECDDGWRESRGGYDRVATRKGEQVSELVFPGLAIGPDGALLIRHHVRRENSSGFAFFGQPIRYHTYSHTEWHRLAPLPAEAVPVDLVAADLPPLPGRLERLEWQIGRERSWASFSGWVRDHVPAGVTITVLREPTWDPVAAALPPDRMRVELAGHWPDVSPDPFTPVLRRNPRVIGAIETKESRPQAGNRRFLRLEFTIRIEPADL
jgi:hypothetical protein